MSRQAVGRWSHFGGALTAPGTRETSCASLAEYPLCTCDCIGDGLDVSGMRRVIAGEDGGKACIGCQDQ